MQKKRNPIKKTTNWSNNTTLDRQVSHSLLGDAPNRRNQCIIGAVNAISEWHNWRHFIRMKKGPILPPPDMVYFFLIIYFLH